MSIGTPKSSSVTANAQSWVPTTVAKRDGVQAAPALQNLASLLVSCDHQPLDALAFLIRFDHTHSQTGIVQHSHDRSVSNLGLLRLGHLAVVTGGFGSLTVVAV